MAEPALAPWANFYILLGSAAAALTGLMFVVITLVNRDERPTATSDGIATFSTPTVQHFSTALLVSAFAEAPWRSLVPAALLIALIGLAGFAYLIWVMHRTRRLDNYRADVEDWLAYTVVPLIAYGALFIGGVALVRFPVNAPFAIAAGVVLLIFMGIRNSWDIVTYIVIGQYETAPEPSTAPLRSEPDPLPAPSPPEA
jgi:hypothetical protein